MAASAARRASTRERGELRVTEHAQRPFLLEVERAGGPLGKPPGAAAEVGHGRADRGFGEYPEPERQRGGADPQAPFEFQDGGGHLKVLLAELPVARAARPPAAPAAPCRSAVRALCVLAGGREQAGVLSVAEHPGRDPEPPGGLRDAHGSNLNIFM